jgi:transcriptional regulator with GAF, ATPase, and Fis domain
MKNTEASDLRFIGTSSATRAIRDEIAFAARSDAKVLITGETGVGKDVIARLIHQNSGRQQAPMAMLNCAGLPDSLVESELFGHMRGSFTDAYRDKPGILESASKGTIFLDEVGEMSQRMQAVLLRFLETGELQRVGADRVHARVDVRIIAATNRDLETEISAGRFREDLYYRLHVVRIHVPPLRERRDDILPLLEYYLDWYRQQHGATRRFSPEVIELLTACSWPGNVRQLKNAVERLVLKSAGATIEIRDLPPDLQTCVDGTRGGGRDHETSTQARPADDDLLSRLLEGGESFWTVVYTPFMRRDLTRAQLKAILSRGLERATGNYRLLVKLFNMPETDYKRFHGFLRKHGCHLAFQPFRSEVPSMRSTSWPQPIAGERYPEAVGL